MKNENYNLVKLLLSKMDNAWRIEKYYLKDAQRGDGFGSEVLKDILRDEKRHIEELRSEVAKRCGIKKFG